MQGMFKSIGAGVASGGATYVASIYILGITNAMVMPSWAPPAAWDALAVFGLGAALVALILHAIFLRVLAANASVAFVSFVGATLLLMVVTGLIANGTKALVAWFIGAALASFVHRQLRPNSSLKRTNQSLRD